MPLARSFLPFFPDENEDYSGESTSQKDKAPVNISKPYISFRVIRLGNRHENPLTVNYGPRLMRIVEGEK